MGTSNSKYHSAVTQKILSQKNPFEVDYCRLFDVGCSGGLDQLFFQFGSRLIATGFDPLIAEINRLRKLPQTGINYYIDAYIGDPLKEVNKQSANPTTNFFSRTSCMAALQGNYNNYIVENFNSGEAIEYSKRRLSLDQYCCQEKIERVDFLKSDTDGNDLNVLLGAENLISKSVLGICVEANFQGGITPDSQVFSNIDTFLRSKGFTLCDLDIHRYSRRALPLPFVYDIYAQTHGGAVVWGDAVYFRDLADPCYKEKWGFEFSERDILLLACFYDIYGLADCCAELITSYPNVFDSRIKIQSLNECVPKNLNIPMEYSDFIKKFERQPSHWMPKQKLFGAKKT